jgi:hypothetical protein
MHMRINLLKSRANHPADNAAHIEREAQAYARNYNCSIEVARRDVRAEYTQAAHEEAEFLREYL